MDETRTGFASLAKLASQSHPIEFLDSLPHLLESVVNELDVGLYDLQRRRLVSLRTGKPVVVEDWPVSVVLEHHGNHLGRLLVDMPVDEYHATDGPSIQALAPVVALNLTASYDFNDRPWTTVRTKEMSLAAEIQATVIPPSSCRGRGFAVSAAVEPAYETGGDIYEYSFDDDRLFLAILDAMGHGLSASIIASLATAALRRARRENATLTEMMSQVDRAIRAQYNGSSYVSAVVVDIDLNTGEGHWVSAGHVPPLLLTKKGIHELTIEPSLPLGMWVTGSESSGETPVGTVMLEPGDSLVLYSDGVIDNLVASSVESVGSDRFRSAVESHGSLYTHRCARDVVEALLQLTGSVLRDDATLMIAHRSATAAS